MRTRNIVAIGGSAGALPGLLTTLAELPEDFPAAICVALHLSAVSTEWLSARLGQATRLRVVAPATSAPLRDGTVYVSRPDHHLIVKAREVLSRRGPRENLWRPAIDVLFRSAAVAHGNRVIGTLLSGQLDDGTAGLLAIKACGGITVIQDPAEAIYPEMPEIAAANVAPDHCVRLEGLPQLLQELVREPAGEPTPIPAALQAEARIAEGDADLTWAERDVDTMLTCPECNGPLRPSSTDPAQLRCLVGHSYRLDSLLHGVSLELERTLWAAAIRQFEQSALLLDRSAAAERQRGRERVSVLYAKRAEEARTHARNLRQLQLRDG